jgi:flagellar assembly protein FliH
MISKVIPGETAGVGQPMPWQTVSGTVPLARHASQYGTPDQADAAVRLAQLQAEKAAAQAERDRLIGEAREKGRREGEAASRQAAAAEVKAVLQRLATAMQQVSELPARLRAQAETDLVQLAVAIAQRIVQRELNVDPAVITGLVRVGLEKVRAQDMLRVRVFPDHQQAIQEYLAQSGAAHVEVIADATQERGGLIFETGRGMLDVSINTQLREIERGLTDRLRGQG